MIRLTPEQIQKKIEFVQQYKAAPNAAEGSKLDANANVTLKKYCDTGSRDQQGHQYPDQPHTGAKQDRRTFRSEPGARVCPPNRKP